MSFTTELVIDKVCYQCKQPIYKKKWRKNRKSRTYDNCFFQIYAPFFCEPLHENCYKIFVYLNANYETSEILVENGIVNYIERCFPNGKPTTKRCFSQFRKKIETILDESVANQYHVDKLTIPIGEDRDDFTRNYSYKNRKLKQYYYNR